MAKVTPDDDGTSVTDSTSVSGNMVLAGLGKHDGKLVIVYLVLIPFDILLLPRFSNIIPKTFYSL